MSETAPVLKFRKKFAAALKNGKTGVRKGDSQIDVNQAIGKVVKPDDLTACLDVYCALFDPWNPPPGEHAFEIGRSTGYKLFSRAIELAPKHDSLAGMMATIPMLTSADPSVVRKMAWATYANRWKALDESDRNRLQALFKQAWEVISSRAKPATLLDALRKSYAAEVSKTAPTSAQLLAFEPPDPKKRKDRFNELVQACGAAWRQDRPGKLKDALKTFDAAFDAFTEFVSKELREPLDMFRMLKWLRAPYETSDRRTYGDVQVALMEPLPHPIQELYAEVSWRALIKAWNKWKNVPTRDAHGFTGEDLTFVMQPLDRAGETLLEARLKGAWKDYKNFEKAFREWRRARLMGRFNLIEILDEVESVDLSKTIKKQMTASPAKYANAHVHHHDPNGPLRRNQKFWLGQKIEDAFSVIWIEGTDPHSAIAYIVLESHPAFIFRASDDALAHLIDEAFFRELARSAAAVRDFMLTYLRIIGFAFEITVAAMSGGVAYVAIEFAKNRIVDAVTDEILDHAGIENPYLRVVAGMASGMAPSAKLGSSAVRNIGEIEAEAAVAASRLAAKADEAADVTRGIAQDVPPSGSSAAHGNVIELDLSASLPDFATQGAKLYSPRPGLTLADRASARLEAASDRLVSYAPMAKPELAGAGAGGRDLHISQRSIDDGGAANVRSGGAGGIGAGGAAKPPVSKAKSKLAKKLRESEKFELLERYDELLDQQSRLQQRRVREAVLDDLEAGKISLSEAETRLNTALNAAKEQTGEMVAAGVIASNFHKAKFVDSFPTRRNGVPVLDLVFSYMEKGKRVFLLVEAKGGEAARMGKVNNYSYEFRGGKLRRNPLPDSAESVRQASGAWYYQRFAEIYMMGGKQNEVLAKQLFEAGVEGRLRTVINKSGVKLDPSFEENSALVQKFFKETKWNRKHGFPIPASGIP